jgi:hypothetical protein
MLIINQKDQIEFNIDLLQSKTPTSMKETMQRYKDWDLNLFYHVVSSPTCRYERKFGKSRIPSNIAKLTAEERFLNILRGKKISGNPKSFFVNKGKPSLSPSQIHDIRSVSFTLCSYQDLLTHFDARSSQYGICFFHDFLQDKGMRNVQYLNDKSQEDIERIVFSSPYLIEMYNSKYDMRWEVEWRLKGDVVFEPDDVAFVIIPYSDYKRLVDLFQNDDALSGYTYLLPASVYTSPVDHLFEIQHSDILSFDQLPLFRGDVGDGLLLDTDAFPELLPNERVTFWKKGGAYLTALAKATIHECYEHRFSSRFLRFVEQLDDSAWSMSCLPDISRIKENLNEPWHSWNHLTVMCYEILFKIQQERITANWD